MRALSLLSCVALCACESVSTKIEAAYIQTEVAGDVALAGSTGTPNLATRQVDVQNGLGLDDEVPSLLLRGEAATGRFRLRVSGFRQDQTGSSVLPAPFGDLAAGTPVSSNLDFFNVKSALSYDLLELGLGEEGRLRLAPGLAVDYVSVDLDVNSTVASGFESVDNQVVVPLPFLLGEIEVGPAFATVDFGGWSGDLGDGNGLYWDLDATIGVRTEAHVEIFGGYRWLSMDVDEVATAQALTADVEVRGWFLGGGLHF